MAISDWLRMFPRRFSSIGRSVACHGGSTGPSGEGGAGPRYWLRLEAAAGEKPKLAVSRRKKADQGKGTFVHPRLVAASWDDPLGIEEKVVASWGVRLQTMTAYRLSEIPEQAHCSAARSL
jgi:hypothetical protein